MVALPLIDLRDGTAPGTLAHALVSAAPLLWHQRKHLLWTGSLAATYSGDSSGVEISINRLRAGALYSRCGCLRAYTCALSAQRLNALNKTKQACSERLRMNTNVPFLCAARFPSVVGRRRRRRSGSDRVLLGSVFGQIFTAVNRMPPRMFRVGGAEPGGGFATDGRAWRANFVGEGSIDAGGP